MVEHRMRGGALRRKAARSTPLPRFGTLASQSERVEIMRRRLGLILVFALLLGSRGAEAAEYYWCESASAYYPAVSTCPVPWRKVVVPPSGSQPQAAAPPPAISSPATAAPSPAQPSAAFQQGTADRGEWESWFAGSQGDFHEGAFYWSGQRSLAQPGSCSNPSMSQAWQDGCGQAQKRLAISDARRRSEPDYKRGWNSWTATAPTQPVAAAPQPAQAPSITPQVIEPPRLQPSAPFFQQPPLLPAQRLTMVRCQLSGGIQILSAVDCANATLAAQQAARDRDAQQQAAAAIQEQARRAAEQQEEQEQQRKEAQRQAAEKANRQAALDAYNSKVRENTEKAASLGYSLTNFEDFKLDGKALASHEARLSLKGWYVKIGNLHIIYSSPYDAMRATQDFDTDRGIHLLIDDAERETRRFFLECAESRAGQSGGCPITILGHAAICVHSNLVGKIETPCVEVEDSWYIPEP